MKQKTKKIKLGCLRPAQVIFNLTVDEDEWLARYCFDKKFSKNFLIRREVLPVSLDLALVKLRAKQDKVQFNFRRDHLKGRG